MEIREKSLFVHMHDFISPNPDIKVCIVHPTNPVTREDIAPRKKQTIRKRIALRDTKE